MSDPSRRNPAKPEPLNPEIEEREEQLAREANREFAAESNMARAPASDVASRAGVPMDEELDPELVEEYCKREPWLLTPIGAAPTSSKYGLIPARFEYLAMKAEAEGDAGKASRFENARKQASRLYHEQMKADFRRLQSMMNRKQIGQYAETLWTNVTRKVENENDSISQFVGFERADQMDAEMYDLARKRVYMNSKWLAININEIPVSQNYRPKPGGLTH